jgi:hypothetical protein
MKALSPRPGAAEQKKTQTKIQAHQERRLVKEQLRTRVLNQTSERFLFH